MSSDQHSLTPEQEAFVDRVAALLDTDEHNHVTLEREFYTGPELAAHAGISYRQANYWTNQGWLWPVHLERHRPTGPGNRLTFPRHEVDVARWMGELVEHGLTPELARTVARHLVDVGSAKLGDRLLITPPLLEAQQERIRTEERERIASLLDDAARREKQYSYQAGPSLAGGTKRRERAKVLRRAARIARGEI